MALNWILASLVYYLLDITDGDRNQISPQVERDPPIVSHSPHILVRLDPRSTSDERTNGFKLKSFPITNTLI